MAARHFSICYFRVNRNSDWEVAFSDGFTGSVANVGVELGSRG